MNLLIVTFAALISTVLWYFVDKEGDMLSGILCLMFWGAAIMWFVDAIYEYVELGADYFTPAIRDMVNDSFLGMSVVALGLIIWVVILLIKDPRGKVKKTLLKND